VVIWIFSSKCYHVAKSLLWNKDTDTKCKIKVFNMYFKKILLCVAETWTCTKREESKLQAAEMKFLRGIVGKTRR
jgi:hypothetical protein